MTPSIYPVAGPGAVRMIDDLHRERLAAEWGHPVIRSVEPRGRRRALGWLRRHPWRSSHRRDGTTTVATC
jgi:hypothetical protein